MAALTFKAGGRERKLFKRYEGGLYYVRFMHNGANVTKCLETKLLEVAKEKAKALIEGTVEGDTMIDRERTFDDLITRYLKSRVGIAEKSQTNDESKAAVIRRTCPKNAREGLALNLSARRVRTGDLKTWLHAQAKAEKWQPRTFNHYHLFLKGVFDLGVADRLLTANEHPFASGLIKRQKRNKVMRHIPTAEQFAAAIAQVREDYDDEYGDFLEFLGLAGLGQAEVLPLRPCDVQGDKVKIIRKKTSEAFTIPIYDWLRPLLQKRIAMAFNEEQKLFQPKCAEAGKKLGKACKRLGFRHFTPRNLRGMLIKRLYDAGVPVKRIAEWQGHQDGGSLIMEVYSEVFCDTDKAAEQADLAKVGASFLKVVNQ